MNRFIHIAGVAALLGMGVGCADVELTPMQWDDLSGMRMVGPTVPLETPANAGTGDTFNEYWNDPRAQVVGHRLYFDAGLSSSGELNCNSCHDLSTAGADVREGSEVLSATASGGFTGRNAPTIYNSGWRKSYSWTGQKKSMWEQIVGPLTGPLHDLTRAQIAGHFCENYDAGRSGLAAECETVSADHQEKPPPTRADVAAEVEALRAQGVSDPVVPDYSSAEELEVFEYVAKALAAYVRTLEARDSAFDRYMGDSYDDRDPTCLSAPARHGARLFVGGGMCDECHSGPLFTNGKNYMLGVDPESPQYVDGVLVDFQTPTLRQISKTAPYMHTGSMADLGEVLEFYNRGGDRTSPELDAAMPPEIADLGLIPAELAALESFLVSLDGRPMPRCWVTWDPDTCGEDYAYADVLRELDEEPWDPCSP